MIFVDVIAFLLDVTHACFVCVILLIPFFPVSFSFRFFSSFFLLFFSLLWLFNYTHDMSTVLPSLSIKTFIPGRR